MRFDDHAYAFEFRNPPPVGTSDLRAAPEMEPRVIVILAWILAGIILVLGLFFALALATRTRQRNKPQLSESDLYDAQATLLEAIKHASADQKAVVDLSGFWRQTKIKRHQRNAVLQPLIANRDVVEARTPRANDFEEILREIWVFATYQAPNTVRLTDRTWIRMVHEGISGRGLVIERVGTMNWQQAGGDINQSPQTNAGRDASLFVGPHNKTDQSSGFTSADLSDLVAALRQDAKQLEAADERSKLRGLANKLEGEIDAVETDSEAIEDSVLRAERHVTRLSGMLTATSTLLESWRKLRGE